MIGYILMAFYIVSCFVLILFVLLQPSKSDASGVFGGGATSAAFGPRGTQTVLAKVTIGAAITFFIIAFLFSIPGLFERKSLGERVGPAQSQSTIPMTPSTPPEQSPAAPAQGTDTQPAATDNKPADQSRPAGSPAGGPAGAAASKSGGKAGSGGSKK